MPRTGRPKTPLELTGEEREQLARWVRRAKSSQALALRCRIILACGEGLDNKTVAEQVGCSQNTVSKWRARFLEARLDGLTENDRYRAVSPPLELRHMRRVRRVLRQIPCGARARQFPPRAP